MIKVISVRAILHIFNVYKKQLISPYIEYIDLFVLSISFCRLFSDS